MYDRLFATELPGKGHDYKEDLNPSSLEVLKDCVVEPGLASAEPGATCQFERQGYFCLDVKDSKPGQLVFNRTVPLRDTWARIEQAGKTN